MTTQLTVTLSRNLSERVRHFANQRHTEISTVVESILNQGLPSTTEQPEWLDLSEPDEATEREMQAYIEMHPMLKQKFLGKYRDNYWA